MLSRTERKGGFCIVATAVLAQLPFSHRKAKTFTFVNGPPGATLPNSRVLFVRDTDYLTNNKWLDEVWLTSKHNKWIDIIIPAEKDLPLTKFTYQQTDIVRWENGEFYTIIFFVHAEKSAKNDKKLSLVLVMYIYVRGESRLQILRRNKLKFIFEFPLEPCDPLFSRCPFPTMLHNASRRTLSPFPEEGDWMSARESGFPPDEYI